MYSVTPSVGELWRELFTGIIEAAHGQATRAQAEHGRAAHRGAAPDRSGPALVVFDHPPPAPLEDLWRRSDQGAVFMCGLPYSLALPRPFLVAAPVPAPVEFGGRPQYWSDFVVRADSGFTTVADTFGRRIALTVPESQSGCVAALTYFMTADAARPLFSEVIAPTITPAGALAAVIGGAAEVAPIDAYALRLLLQHRPDVAAQVRVVGRTVSTPIPPLVASRDVSGRLQTAFLAAQSNAALSPLLDRLLLQGFVLPDADSYALLRARFAQTAAYWRTQPFAAVTHPAFSWTMTA